MSDLRTAAQQALKALHEIAWCNDSRWRTDRAESVIPALRAALAQEEQEPTVRFKCTVVDNQHPNGVPFEQWVNAPQQDEPKGGGNLPPPLQAEPVQEPVAWANSANIASSKVTRERGGQGDVHTWSETKSAYHDKPLYTAPPRREWQSLSEEEIDRWTPEIHPVIRAVEAALKEKNA